jgi:hypothetical protein
VSHRPDVIETVHSSGSFAARVADLYFEPWRFERDGRLYRWLGVGQFKHLVTWLGRAVGRRSDRPNNYFLWDRSERGLVAFERKTRWSEVVHLLAVVAPSLGIIMMLTRATGSISRYLVLGVILLLNLYPLLLQRLTRARLHAALRRLRERGSKPAGGDGSASARRGAGSEPHEA